MNGRLAFAARLLLTVVTALAWLAVSNHCVLAAGPTMSSQAEANPAHGRCPGHPAPSAPGDQPKPMSVECCKTLSAAFAGFDRSRIGYQPGDFIPFRFSSARLCQVPAAEESAVAKLDTGPPALSSFAETVLQRSLLAHAPPPLA